MMEQGGYWHASEYGTSAHASGSLFGILGCGPRILPSRFRSLSESPTWSQGCTVLRILFPDIRDGYAVCIGLTKRLHSPLFDVLSLPSFQAGLSTVRTVVCLRSHESAKLNDINLLCNRNRAPPMCGLAMTERPLDMTMQQKKTFQSLQDATLDTRGGEIVGKQLKRAWHAPTIRDTRLHLLLA